MEKTKKSKAVKKPKTIKLTVIIDRELYDMAKDWCGFSDEEIKERILDEGVSGLSNYCNAQENWLED